MQPRNPKAAQLRRVGNRRRERSAAFADDPMEEAFGQWRYHKVVGGDGPRGLTEDGHVVRIAAESRDVFLYPLQRRDLVEQSVVARCVMFGLRAEFRQCKESEFPESVVDRDQHNAFFGKLGSVVNFY